MDSALNPAEDPGYLSPFDQDRVDNGLDPIDLRFRQIAVEVALDEAGLDEPLPRTCVVFDDIETLDQFDERVQPIIADHGLTSVMHGFTRRGFVVRFGTEIDAAKMKIIYDGETGPVG